MKLQYLKPDIKILNENTIQREMLKEAIALLVIEGTSFNTESTARRVIRNTVLKRLMDKKI